MVRCLLLTGLYRKEERPPNTLDRDQVNLSATPAAIRCEGAKHAHDDAACRSLYPPRRGADAGKRSGAQI